MTANNIQTTLPLSSLRVDEKSNVRVIGRGVDPTMLASIKAHGLTTVDQLNKPVAADIVPQASLPVAAVPSAVSAPTDRLGK